MKILLTLCVLFFSSFVSAELPNSFFGIEINESINEYKKEDAVEREYKAFCNQQKRPKISASGEIKEILPEEIEVRFMTNHPLFDSQCVHYDNKSLITGVTAINDWNFFNDFEKSDINRFGLKELFENHLEIINTLSSLYEIKTSKFNNSHSFVQKQVKVDISEHNIKSTFNAQTLFLVNTLAFKINNKKMLLYVFSYAQKMRDPEKSETIFNNLLGSGYSTVGLVNESNDLYNHFKNWKKICTECKDNWIKLKEVDKYINLMTKQSSSF